MVERSPPIKVEEQYPLLKVDAGGGDVATNQQVTPALVATGWGVTCAPKQSWLVRWPEYISACWMTLILLGISFLVFYTLGMEAYRRQPVLLIKCNGSKPASDVFYHQIVPRGSVPPFMLYAEYLSSMALKYPYLNIHVYFLVDDFVQTSYRAPRQSNFINTLFTMPIYKLDDNWIKTKRTLIEFQKKYQNINVTVMPLSKYMAMTPLKYKWRNIPTPYLSFYARVFSVWQYGGVGLDLETFNNYFNDHQNIDRRISAILRQHNDGIKPEEYTNALYKIDCEEESEKFFSLVCGLITSIFNETKSFFTNSFQPPRIIAETNTNLKPETLVRTHRNKRDVPPVQSMNNVIDTSSVSVLALNSTNITDPKKHEYMTSLDNINSNNNTVKTSNDQDNRTSLESIENIQLEKWNKSKTNKSDHPQVVLFYDFSVFSDAMGPPFILPDAFMRSEKTLADKDIKSAQNSNLTYLLSLDPEGLFIAASERLHPFLGQLISAGCQRMHPKFAIQNTLLTQCSGLFREDTYCNNIYLL